MKPYNLLPLIICASIMASCSKAPEYKYDVESPVYKQYEPLATKIKGFRCDLINEHETKQIFIAKETKESQASLNFYELKTSSTIYPIGATFGGYTLFGLNLDGQVATGAIIHEDPHSLSLDGNVTSVGGKVTLKENMSGVLEQKLFMLKDDKLVITEYKEIAKIENCEAAKVSFF